MKAILLTLLMAVPAWGNPPSFKTVSVASVAGVVSLATMEHLKSKGKSADEAKLEAFVLTGLLGMGAGLLSRDLEVGGAALIGATLPVVIVSF